MYDVGGGRCADPDVDRAQQGLERVGQQRVLVPPAGDLLTVAEQQMLAEPEPTGDAGQRAHVHDRRA